MLRPDFDGRPPIEQHLRPGETIRLINWSQEGTPSGIFEAGGRGIVYGGGPARIVRTSFSSIGDSGLRIETERVLTTPRRA